MRITAKLFALITIAFGINEASKPIQEVDYDEQMQHSQEVIDSTLENLLYIRKVNDSLINKFCPYEEDI
jgi:hypothetical protein